MKKEDDPQKVSESEAVEGESRSESNTTNSSSRLSEDSDSSEDLNDTMIAFAMKSEEYAFYYVFDLDEGVALSFSTTDTDILAGLLTEITTGTFEIEYYYDEQWTELFVVSSDRRSGTLYDDNFEYSFERVQLQEVDDVLASADYTVIEIE